MTKFTYKRGAQRIATAAAVLLLATIGVCAQIAPGPLSRSHAQLDGVRHCTDCHKATTTEFACLDCHKEIAGRLAGGRGFHAAAVSGAAPGRDCRRCHSEHKGENTELIRKAMLNDLDHSKTGYRLEGKHATLACQRCHNPEHIAAADITDVKIKDLKRTFFGLRRSCLTCHADQHRGQLNLDCQKCHTFREWKNPPGFDHDKAKFRRTGEHAKVACQKCHAPSPANRGSVQYIGLAFAHCNDCHRDPHRGTFPNACESCHNPSGWKRTDIADKFSHSRTKFALEGKHAELDCLKCHAGGDFKRPLAFDKCTDCHQPDSHSGQFAQRADKGECSACHTVEGFKAVRFAVRDHSATAFPLVGKHADVACAKCHVPAGKTTAFRLKFASCTDCHKDSHEAQFAGAPHSNHCDDCHTVQGFDKTTFTVTRHDTARFQLTGAHASVECAKCHKPQAGQPSAVRFHFDDRSCGACHLEPHRGQFRQLGMRDGSDGSAFGCQICHSLTSWKDMHFAHNVEGFPLLGIHRTTACIKCHQPARPDIPLKEVDFHSAPSKCEGCHQEFHLGQFAQADGITACVDCHSSARWVPAQFDHDRRTRFPLPGKHRSVKCAACHKNIKLVQGKHVTVFKPTPTECAACHQKPV
jgi:hypothetical protein